MGYTPDALQKGISEDLKAAREQPAFCSFIKGYSDEECRQKEECLKNGRSSEEHRTGALSEPRFARLQVPVERHKQQAPGIVQQQL